jgi:hypothetical protein
MFAFAHDHDRHALVARMMPPTVEADWQAAVDAYGVLARESNAAGAWGTLIVIAHDGSGHPNAAWRQRLAESNKRFKKMRFCLVSRSSITRTVLALVNWLTPSTPGMRRRQHGTFAEAVAWCEVDAGEPMTFLADLYVRASRVGQPTRDARSTPSRAVGREGPREGPGCATSGADGPCP